MTAVISLQVMKLGEFKELVLADASDVHNRDDTDTIDIIDCIRFHITNFIQTFSEMQDAEDQLRAIDDFLMTLGLEC